MKIGEAAKLTGLAISNIRFYEKKGLLNPQRDTENQYREYSPQDVEQLKRIIVLRKMDIPLETIYLLFEEKISFSEIITRHEEELHQKVDELKGSIELCREIAKEESILDIDPDRYLDFVADQEERGRRFAVVTELVNDFGDYNENVFFAGGLRGMSMYFGKYGKLVKIGYILFWMFLVFEVGMAIVTREITWVGLIIYGFLFVILIRGFYLYRKEREEG